MANNNESQKSVEDTVKRKRKMPRGLKIGLVSVASLLGLFIVVATVALWLLLSPSRLTSIVNKLSDKFILCENHFGDVNLTLFKTFPYVGLNVKDVTLINPMEGSSNDTLARFGQLSVGINLREYLKNSNIEVTKLVLEDIQANIFTDSAGNTNYDIFPKSTSQDTSSEPFEAPELVSLQCIKVKHLDATYTDIMGGIVAGIDDFNLSVDGTYVPDNIKAALDIGADKITLTTRGDSNKVDATLNNMTLTIDGDTKDKRFDGSVAMKVSDGLFAIDGQEFVNQAVKSSKGNLLELKGNVSGDYESLMINIDKLIAELKGYALELSGDVSLPDGDCPMSVDVSFATGQWAVNALLSMLPPQFTEWKKGMDMDASLKLEGTAKGNLSGDELPLIEGNLKLSDGHFTDKSLLPYSFNKISADIMASLNLNDNGVSSVDVNSLSATTGRNNVAVKGHIDDLLGKMQTDATIQGLIYLADIKPMMPDDLNMSLNGVARLNLKAVTNLDQLQKSDFAHMRLSGSIGLNDIDFEYDTIYARIPKATLNIHLPSALKRGLFNELLSATLSCSSIEAKMPNNSINATIGETMLNAAISDIFDTTLPMRMVCDFDFASLNGNMDTVVASLSKPSGSFSMVPKSKRSEKVRYDIKFNANALRCKMDDSTSIDLAGLSMKGGCNYDPSRNGLLQQLAPNLDVDFKLGYINLPHVDYVVQIPDIKFNYTPERCEIASANVVIGNSDFYLKGAVTGLDKWLSHEDMLRGDLYFTSNYTNVDDLLDIINGMGTDPDTLERQRKEDNVDTAAHPFIVPRDVNFTLHTRIKEATAFDNELREVAGDVTVNDGVAILNQVGFVCKAARMQLTGLYRTPRVNHIFVGLDFHLLDINIQELVSMIPYVDTLVPLLNDLEGAADFHLCAETYVNAFYQPKMSTLRAAAALTGQNLVVLDNKDIDKIAKLLQLKQWREDDTKIHVDSLDVAMTVFRKELEVYPFLLSLHKYQIVAEGRHNIDNNYDYHVELVQSPLPVRLAVDVQGTLPKLNFSLSPKLRYKNLYRPARRSDVDEYVLKMKRMVRESLEANVKEGTRTYEGFE